MLLLLHPPLAITVLVLNLQFDSSPQPSERQLAAYASFLPVHNDGVNNTSLQTFGAALATLPRSPLAVLSSGWYMPLAREDVYNYTLDFTTNALSLNVRGTERMEWAGLSQLHMDAVQSVITSAKLCERWVSGDMRVDAEASESRKDVAKSGGGEGGRQRALQSAALPGGAHGVRGWHPAVPRHRHLRHTSLHALLQPGRRGTPAVTSDPSTTRDVLDAVRCCYDNIAVQPSVNTLYRLACTRELLGPLQPAIVPLQAAMQMEKAQSEAEASDRLARLMSRQVADKARELSAMRAVLMSGYSM